MKRLLVVLLLSALVLIGAGCGSSSSTSTGPGASSPTTTSQVSHPAAKFVLHAGLAFGAFHHWIYKPFKAGDFSHPFRHKLTLLKAGLAAVFVYHELKLALADAQASPTLSKLVAPITALQNKIHGATSGLSSGQASPGALGDIENSISSIHQQAAGVGQSITEQVPSAL